MGLDVVGTNALHGGDGGRGKVRSEVLFGAGFGWLFLRRHGGDREQNGEHGNSVNIQEGPLEAIVVKEYSRIVNGNMMPERHSSEHRTGVTLPVALPAFRFHSGFCPATAGSVFRASTSAEIADVFPRLKDRKRRTLLGIGELAVDVLHFLFDPSNAGDFNLAVLSDQEQCGDIGQAVSIGDNVAVRIVEQSAEGNAVLF